MSEVIAPEAHDRTKLIGGSDISAILGISPWKTAADLWLDKTRPRVEDGKNAAAKRRGTRLEPYIVDMIREEYGYTVVQRGQRYLDPEVPFFAAEIDVEFESDDGDGVIDNGEIKTVHPFKAKEWGSEDSDQLPLHYLAQTQWGLGIKNRRRCRVFALIGDDLKQYIVERDDETIQAMRERAYHFWTEYVIPQKQPPLDYANSRTLKTLQRLYPGTDGSTIEAQPEHEHWRAVMKTAQEMRDHYEAVINGARAHILAEMGNAALLRFPDGKAFRRKQISKKAMTVQYAASSYFELRLVDAKE